MVPQGVSLREEEVGIRLAMAGLDRMNPYTLPSAAIRRAKNGRYGAECRWNRDTIIFLVFAASFINTVIFATIKYSGGELWSNCFLRQRGFMGGTYWLKGLS